MKITVTKKYINNGKRYDDCNCPIALAIRGAIRNSLMYVSVGRDQIQVGSHSYPIPQEAHEFAEDFDDGKPVSPFAFELPIEEAAP